MQILNSKIFSEFVLSDFYFILNIYLLLLGLIFTKYLYSIYNNVIIIDLSIIFLLFFNSYLYDINIDLFLGFKLIIFYVFIKLNFVKNLSYKFRVKEVGFFINLLYKKFLNVVFENTYKKLQLENVLIWPTKLVQSIGQNTVSYYHRGFVKGVNIYGVHKDDIYIIGGMIMHVNMAKARQVTLKDYAKISKEIANNPEVNKFINIDPKTKEIYEQNYKILKDLKKD